MTIPGSSTPPALCIGTSAGILDVPDDRTTYIGRHGDVVVGADNPYVHRHLLTVTPSGATWRLQNIGTYIAVAIQDPERGFIRMLEPGEATLIEWLSFDLVFSAGEKTYAVNCDAELPGAAEPTCRSLHGTETIGGPDLTEDQLMLLAAIAENILANPVGGGGRLVSNADVCRRLGWVTDAGTVQKKKFDHRLDDVCADMAAAGVPGLVPDPGDTRRRMTNRRHVAVQHAIDTGALRQEHLDLVDAESARNGGLPGPRRVR